MLHFTITTEPQFTFLIPLLDFAAQQGIA